MIGTVDKRGRALIDVDIRRNPNSNPIAVTTWIDTAFDGHLVFPTSLIEKLQLDSLVETEAILADGTKVTLDTFVCFVDWFGDQIPLQVIANDGKFPLLGTGLLEQRVLHIDYAEKQLTLH